MEKGWLVARANFMAGKDVPQINSDKMRAGRCLLRVRRLLIFNGLHDINRRCFLGGNQCGRKRNQQGN